MEMIKHRNGAVATLLLVGFLVAVVVGWFNRGYGEVSPMTYQYSKALYSACLSRNEAHLSAVEEMLADSDSEALPADERRWIDDILAKALDGQWSSAANQARRMMEDQVRF